MQEKKQDCSLVRRHSLVELAQHWLLAISGLVLIFSGFGELPMYKRYMLTQLPLLDWAGDFHIQLKLHYLSAIVFVSLMLFHFLYHGLAGHRGLVPRKGDLAGSVRTVLAMFGLGKEPQADKFLPEQRLAYAYMAVVGGVLVLTGVVKVIKNLDGVYLPPGWVTGVTLVHTFATIFFLLGVLAHLGALLIKANRPLLRAIFTGWVNARYARERHGIWWERTFRGEQGPRPGKQSPGESSGQDSAGGAFRTAPPVPGVPDGSLAPRSCPDAAPQSDGLPARSRAGGL